MARKNGNGTLPALGRALERHLDARERPIVTALTGIAGTLRSIDDRLGRVGSEARGMRTQLQSIDTRLGRVEGEVRGLRTDLRSLNKTTAANFEQLREDLHAKSIPTRRPKFHREAAE